MWIFKAQQSCITLPNGNTWATHSNGKILAVFSVLNPAANGGWERVLQHALQTSRDSSRPAEMQVTDFSWEPALECLRTSLLCLYFWCSNNWRTAEALASAKCSVCSCGVGISWAARIPHTWQTGRLQSWAELVAMRWLTDMEEQGQKREIPAVVFSSAELLWQKRALSILQTQTLKP